MHQQYVGQIQAPGPTAKTRRSGEFTHVQDYFNRKSKLFSHQIFTFEFEVRGKGQKQRKSRCFPVL
jgi:hypothetical protein